MTINAALTIVGALTMRRLAIKAGAVLARLARLAFAPYVVLDDFGTCQRCWTYQAAFAWLPSCSGRCCIVRLRPLHVSSLTVAWRVQP